MAIQFARVGYVSRSQGKNACCKSSYNARQKIHDERSDVTYTFERLKDNVHHEVLLPQGVNKKFKEASVLANEVERSEKRKNSQLYKEYVLALPDDKGIDLKDRIEICRRFIERKEFLSERLGVQLDIHRPHDGDKNWHAHLLVTTRRFNDLGDGLGEKARDLEPSVRGGSRSFVKDGKEEIGALMRDIQNEYFKEKGLDLRVDAISKSPGVHLGPVRMRGLMNEVAQFHEERRQIDLSKTEKIQGSEHLLKVVTSERSVFTQNDLNRVVERHGVQGGLNPVSLVESSISSPSIVPLWRKSGELSGLYTTVAVREEEKRCQRIADRIYGQKRKNIKLRNSKYSLNGSQTKALNHLLGWSGSGSSLQILEGHAGTGKSRVLGEVYNFSSPDQRVFGLSPTHKAVSELKQVGYEEAHTVKGFLFKVKKGHLSVPRRSLIVVDEAGMVGNESYQELLKVVRGSKSDLILSGDDRQLSSIERGGLFSVFKERYGCVCLDKVIRQKETWAREVSESFSKGDALLGLEILRDKDRLIGSDTPEDSVSDLLSQWGKSSHDFKDRLMLSIKNESVDVLNLGARVLLKQQGHLQGPEFHVSNSQGYQGNYAQGDRIVITQTDKRAEVQNGDFGTLQEVSKERFKFKFDDGRELYVNPDAVNFKHGYASTVYKAQGASIRDVYVLHQRFGTSQNSYVSLSRHVSDLHLYYNRQNTPTGSDFASQMSRQLDKVCSLNFMTEGEYKDLERVRREESNQKGYLDSQGWLSGLKNDRLRGVVQGADLLATKAYKSFEVKGHEGIVHRALQGAKSLEKSLGDRFHSNEDYYKFDIPIERPSEVREVLESHRDQEDRETIYNATLLRMPRADLPKENSSQSSDPGKPSGDKVDKFMDWTHRVNRVRHELKFCSERLSRDLLGEPNKHLSTGNNLRFGEHGKISVEIRGPRSGVWHDFSTGAGGDLFSLIQREKGITFKDSLSFAEDYVGSDVTSDLLEDKRLRDLPNLTPVNENELGKEFGRKQEEPALEKVQENTPEVVEERPEKIWDPASREKIEKAEKSFEKSKELNALCLSYLKTRGLENLQDTPDLRSGFGYAPEKSKFVPALIGFGRDETGRITGGQRILLDEHTGNKYDCAINKRSFGVIKGSFVTVQEDDKKTGRTFIAEGLETALSIKESGLQGKVVASLGIHNFKNYQPESSPSETLILCGDNDGPKSHTQFVLDRAVKSYEESGHKAHLVQPESKGQDFNDVLKERGKEGVREIFTKADIPICVSTPEKEQTKVREENFREKSPLFHESPKHDREGSGVERKDAKDLSHQRGPLSEISHDGRHVGHEYLSHIRYTLNSIPRTENFKAFNDHIKQMIDYVEYRSKTFGEGSEFRQEAIDRIDAFFKVAALHPRHKEAVIGYVDCGREQKSPLDKQEVSQLREYGLKPEKYGEYAFNNRDHMNEKDRDSLISLGKQGSIEAILNLNRGKPCYAMGWQCDERPFKENTLWQNVEYKTKNYINPKEESFKGTALMCRQMSAVLEGIHQLSDSQRILDHLTHHHPKLLDQVKTFATDHLKDQRLVSDICKGLNTDREDFTTSNQDKSQERAREREMERQQREIRRQQQRERTMDMGR